MADEVCVRMLQKLHPTSHPPLTTRANKREILTECDILSIWDPLSRTAFAVRGIMPERAAR